MSPHVISTVILGTHWMVIVADALRALQRRYLADADLVDLAEWRRRPPWHRFAENSFRLLGPLL